MREAEFYKKLENLAVKCELCPHYCIIENGQSGRCKSRQNRNGKLIATNYGKTIGLSIDPIEKKPLYHFYPHSQILSIGANSCNFSCDFCQNYLVSQHIVHTKDMGIDDIIRSCQIYNIEAVAFTYTEPFTWYEFILDCAPKLQENGIKIVLVTNGYINPLPLEKLLPYISAMNIDLKAYDNNFYIEYCKGTLKPVLQTVRTAYKYCHIELTNLLIPTLNDSIEDLHKIIGFVADLDVNIPLHFSKYFPKYKMKIPPTDISKLNQAYNLSKAMLNYVYLGNIDVIANTYCPNCHNLIIDRTKNKTSIRKGKCRKCGQVINGVF